MPPPCDEPECDRPATMLLVHGSTIVRVLEQGLPMRFCDEHGGQRLREPGWERIGGESGQEGAVTPPPRGPKPNEPTNRAWIV
jgi:hypothetical protein